MGNENNEVVTTPIDSPTKEEPTKIDDVAIENQALRETLQELKDSNKQLLEELKSVKLSNAKLLASLDLSDKKKSTEEIMNDLFNPYK